MEGSKMDLENEIKQIDEIEAWSTVKTANKYFNLKKETRPCISQLLLSPMVQGGRSRTGLIIATELKRTGKTLEQIEKDLVRWNSHNDPPLPEKDIRGIKKSMDKINKSNEILYGFGCNKEQVIVDHCVGKENCNYYLNNFKTKSRRHEPDYTASGWQLILTLTQRHILFHILPQMERRKKCHRGNFLVVSLRELAEYSGIGSKYFKKNFEALREFGLIEFKSGTPRRWERKATEIKRILPPPRPDKRKVEEFKKSKEKSIIIADKIPVKVQK